MGKQQEHWGEFSHVDSDEEWFEVPFDEEGGDGIVFLDEAHEALNRLYQKTNKRGRLMRTPKRADSWQ